MNDHMNNLPLWARFIAFLGFPIAVATLLLWVVVQQLNIHNHLLEMHDTKVDTHAQAASRHSEEMHDAVHQLGYVLQIMCQNAATDPQDRNRCVEKP